MGNTITIGNILGGIFGAKEKKGGDRLTPEEAKILKYLSSKEIPEHGPKIAEGTQIHLSKVYSTVKVLVEKLLLHKHERKVDMGNGENITQINYTISIIGRRVAETLPEQED